MNADWLLRYTCDSVATLLNADWLSHAKFVSKFKYLTWTEFVAPQILVNALPCARRKCGATNQNLSPVFSREKFARYASLRSLCMGSCHPLAFGVKAQIFPDWAKLAKIASTIPVSSVPAERAFSLQNRIKTSIRNRLAEEKVTRLMCISSLGPGLKDFNFREQRSTSMP